MSAFSGMGSFVMPIGDDSPPTNELGSVVNEPTWLPQWHTLTPLDELEANPKLTFPESIGTYHSMRTDPQVQGLLTGATWPIYRMNWYLEPNDARPEIVEKLSADLNLPIGENQPPDPASIAMRRTQNRFKFIEHLEYALDSLCYGFQVFEQVGEIQSDGLFHYTKLAYRPVQTIVEMSVARDGGLEWVRQFGINEPLLPITRLVVYPFQRRGANWHGRSLLRGCYGPWLLKDRAMRVGVMNIQRAGVGTPIIQGHPGATDADLILLENLAKRFVAGDRSGGVIPYGANLRLVGVEGSQPDAVGFIKLMNEEMSRAFFQMFMQLGQTTTGSRALGQTFVDYHKLVIEYIASWFASIFNEHVIEDDVEWNYGPDEEYAPLIQWAWNEDAQSEEEEESGQTAAQNPSQQLERMVESQEIHLPDELIRRIRTSPGRSGPSRAKHQPTRVTGGSHSLPASASPAVVQNGGGS
jgi:hypothetical protein